MSVIEVAPGAFDIGAVLYQEPVSLLSAAGEDTLASNALMRSQLESILAARGAAALVETLTDLEERRRKSRPQSSYPHTPSEAKKLPRSIGYIDWARDDAATQAIRVHNATDGSGVFALMRLPHGEAEAGAEGEGEGKGPLLRVRLGGIEKVVIRCHDNNEEGNDGEAVAAVATTTSLTPGSARLGRVRAGDSDGKPMLLIACGSGRRRMKSNHCAGSCENENESESMSEGESESESENERTTDLIACQTLTVAGRKPIDARAFINGYGSRANSCDGKVSVQFVVAEELEEELLGAIP